MLKPAKKVKVYQVIVTVRSENGTRPIARVLGGDTVFVFLTEGQTARIVTKLVKQERK